MRTRTGREGMPAPKKNPTPPSRKEIRHFEIMGDTATSKTQLIIQQLLQIEERNEIAIVHDPEREYTPRFYRPERGDVILFPCDRRMPFWSIGDEVRNPAEASALRSEEHTSELQSRLHLVCRLLLEKKHCAAQPERERHAQHASERSHEQQRNHNPSKDAKPHGCVENYGSDYLHHRD